MHDLKQIFLCPKCGEVESTSIETWDTQTDEEYFELACNRCFGWVLPKMENGKPCYRQMSQEEIWAEQDFYDPEF